jgi:hypothetical protein
MNNSNTEDIEGGAAIAGMLLCPISAAGLFSGQERSDIKGAAEQLWCRIRNDCPSPPPPPAYGSIDVTGAIIASCHPTGTINQNAACNIAAHACTGLDVNCGNTARQYIQCDESVAKNLATLVENERADVQQFLAAALKAQPGTSLREKMNTVITQKCQASEDTEQFAQVKNFMCDYAKGDVLNVLNNVDQHVGCAMGVVSNYITDARHAATLAVENSYAVYKSPVTINSANPSAYKALIYWGIFIIIGIALAIFLYFACRGFGDPAPEIAMKVMHPVAAAKFVPKP